ncbi:Zn-ribbon domain-containing OB-fold protein [Phenylobacterium sp.]|uniref:Zn-ribbon domain-containing OB-fold protein n=1 Tax=Phenylobacterium sp. TaxID=1871053 RepID=UPI0027321B7E|nr:Zn-ribbon domain-containing OB-fold protein [Phenylobacterium sp.]MDP1599169.1 Zn-ribbon domain-containing OB-fold protein [Phenylobacterium sp.]MDP3591909.1 Zn-ribbon domain-containing OB-fold protein [Phenylobacterium sp.]
MTDVQDRPTTMTRNIPAPAVTIESKPFWDAATEGKFMIKRCNACGEAHWYPRALCPFCFSEKTVWEESPGEGVIYSYSVMHRSPSGPYAIGYVTLAEGPAVLTNFVDVAPDGLSIGQKVKVKFQPTENGPPVPVFAPA